MKQIMIKLARAIAIILFILMWMGIDSIADMIF